MQDKIQKLEPENYHKCNNIWNMSKNPEMTQKWYHEIVAGNRIVFVYVHNGEYIGEGSLVFENGDPDYTIKNKRIYLSRMIVKPAYQNKGIGGTILDFLIEYAKNHGVEEISVGVDKVNARARHLYGKKGFDTIVFDGKDEYGEYIKLIKHL